MIRNLTITLAVTALLQFASQGVALADEYYVSKARGKGKEATKEKPAKDLANLIALLKTGDVIHLAEGVYTSRDDGGSDSIGVAVQIIGGWDDAFTKRDPWGAHRTVLSGTSAISGSTGYRLIIQAGACPTDVVVDGIIFDNGPRNQYSDEKELAIVRRVNAGKNMNASPESGGLKIVADTGCKVVVRNNVVMNSAPTGGALVVQANSMGNVTITKNLIINNTGEGIFAMTKWHGRNVAEAPVFTISGNTILFSWKHDAIATYGGNALKLDNEVNVTATGNVFGFGDYGGVDNIKKAYRLALTGNLFVGNQLYDYREYNTSINVDEMEDEADLLAKGSVDNVSKEVSIPLSAAWTALYAGRTEISRAAVDDKAKAANSGANAVRGMLGLPLQAGTVNVDAGVWLHRLQIDDALAAGRAPYDGKYGCHTPVIK